MNAVFLQPPIIIYVEFKPLKTQVYAEYVERF